MFDALSSGIMLFLSVYVQRKAKTSDVLRATRVTEPSSQCHSLLHTTSRDYTMVSQLCDDRFQRTTWAFSAIRTNTNLSKPTQYLHLLLEHISIHRIVHSTG